MAPVPIEVVYVEPVYCPQAVLDWYASGSREKKKEIMANRNVKSSEMSLRAKKHLSAAGWEISYVEKKGKVPELRYKSPKGRSYHSLRMACLECIKDLGLHSKDMTAKTDQNLMQGIVKRGGLDVAVLGSRKRRNPSDQDVNTWKPQKGKVTVAAEHGHNVIFPSNQKPQSILSLLIDEKAVLPNAKVLCIRKKDQRQLKVGNISRDGIICTCCQDVLTLSGFEAHAGKIYGGPAASIVLEDGRTLLECQRQLLSKMSSTKQSYDCISFDGCSVDSEVSSEDQIGESEVEQFQPTEEWCKKNCPDFFTDDFFKLSTTVKLEKEEKSDELMEFLRPDLKDESLKDLDLEDEKFWEEFYECSPDDND